MTPRRILLIDDEENILVSLKGVLEDEGFFVDTAKNGEEGLKLARRFSPDVVLLDIWMPGEDGIETLGKLKKYDPSLVVVMMSGHGTVETAVKTIKLGAFDFLEKPVSFDKVMLVLQHAFDLSRLRAENEDLKEKLRQEESFVGNSPPVRHLKALISLAAPSNGWVLIQGENGTGKELVARAFHKKSTRAEGRFVAVNCAAIPEELIESELFGHEKGAFTGAADRKIGKFEQADGGTLFLDEVGDMGHKMQAKILRALQECSIQRVGGDGLIEVDIRVIAATNKNLKEGIEKGTFREDLFYRLNVIPIQVPPLRDRKTDIPILVKHFLHCFAAGSGKEINQETYEILLGYSWPGNVRELKNWVERACILSETNVIDSWDVGGIESETQVNDTLAFEEKSLRAARAAFERQFILKMLSENGGNISKTAQVIGVERSHLHKKMRSYGIRDQSLQ